MLSPMEWGDTPQERSPASWRSKRWSGQYYGSDQSSLPPAIRLERAVLEANLDIYEQAVTVDAQAGMGTTLVAAVIHEDRLTVANVGDSRAYLVRDGEIAQITDDHSWVAEQVKLGAMTDKQAQNHAYRNVVTRCLGHKPGIQVDIFEHKLRVGDIVLLCSDGLSNQVSVERIGRALVDCAPAEAANKLIDLANQAGGPDNITALIVQVAALAPESEPSLCRARRCGHRRCRHRRCGHRRCRHRRCGNGSRRRGRLARAALHKTLAIWAIRGSACERSPRASHRCAAFPSGSRHKTA